MQILIIGPAKDFSGYAHAMRNYTIALDKIGSDVVLRAVKYDQLDPGSESDISQIKHLLKKKISNLRAVINYTTPNESRICDIPGVQNIIMTTIESTEVPKYWVEKLNKFDKVITFCEATKLAFKSCGVTKPIYVVPHTFNLPYSLEGITPLSLGNDFDLSKRFVLYNISQLSHKKGLDCLLRAYYRAFWQNPDEVFLILKTYINMANRSKDKEIIANFVGEVKQGMRLPQYPQVAILTSTMSDDQLKRLHKTGQCYVSSARYEGFGIPPFEALAFGNKVVMPYHTGHEVYGHKHGVPRPNVFNYESRITPMFNQQHADPELFTSRGLWHEPDMLSLEKAMVDAKNAKLADPSDLSEFNYQNIGNQLMEIINA